MDDLKKKIREVPDWPRKGVSFKDITTLLQDKDAFKIVIDSISEAYKDMKIDKVVGIDARGFLIAAPVAYKLSSGLSIVRKAGKLPFSVIQKEYILEYGTNTIEMHADAVSAGEKIVLIDDLIATGGTAIATCNLIEELGGNIAGITFVIDMPFLGGTKRLKEMGYQVRSLLKYEDGESEEKE